MRMQLALDEEGWAAGGALAVRTLDELIRLQAERVNRRAAGASGDRAGTIGLLVFQRPEQRIPTRFEDMVLVSLTQATQEIP